MQMTEEWSGLGENQRQEQNLTLSPIGSTQVNGYSRVHDQDGYTDFKGELKVDNIGSIICSNARYLCKLAKLRHDQLRKELELVTAASIRSRELRSASQARDGT